MGKTDKDTDKDTDKKVYTARDLADLLRAKYPGQKNGYNQYVVLEQVPDGTGQNQNRWIDAVVFSMWQSHGLRRAAFEIKVSRSDFLHEMANPFKHQWCRECFHQFWFVAPKGLIDPGELPAEIGLMCPRGKQLVIQKQAVNNESPRLDDSLLAGFIRAAWKEINRDKFAEIQAAMIADPGFQLAKSYMDATSRFLQERGQWHPFDPDEQTIFKALEDATLDNELKQNRDQFFEIVNGFQREIAALLDIFLIIAKRALFTRDQTGKFIVHRYGGIDEGSLEQLQKHLADPKRMAHLQRYEQLISTILTWNGLEGGTNEKK